ncbi:hypothetical protein [Vulcanisaeta souniana]|uniref:Uncharacterized protein n=1 Tax=Vulcanisaeta souniana JCM 11219 TaxID=1293586 RepID=A0A830EEE3_9CREN|nr:hypothetical protein [Vulcanisaeta souniana]BDR91993.1 hypothetical protein Vsou_10860 [Vulcanisaeta souniana JCM 11219]GGI68738.1 hypothetical protein GCM10007112_02190 [Vulcanisaeta souniana JCM 11219]
MIIEIKKFNSLNELIQSLKNELSNSNVFMYILRQNWNELLGSENNVVLANEISEIIKFIDGGTEVFSLKFIYKSGTNTKSNVINEAAGYEQLKTAIIKSIIYKLESLSNINKDKPLIALLVDSIPIMIIMQGSG